MILRTENMKCKNIVKRGGEIGGLLHRDPESRGRTREAYSSNTSDIT
jgi:hypothetical protein